MLTATRRKNGSDRSSLLSGFQHEVRDLANPENLWRRIFQSTAIVNERAHFRQSPMDGTRFSLKAKWQKTGALSSECAQMLHWMDDWTSWAMPNSGWSYQDVLN
jgi:hypothetical protein